MFLSRRGFLALPVAAAIQRTGTRLLGTMPFEGSPEIPLGRLIGRGLDARLFTDLSTLDAADLITPTNQFFIRTEHPSNLPDAARWAIAVSGGSAKPFTVRAVELSDRARPMGTLLLECAGNSNPRDYGLMSVARWSGVRLMDILASARALPDTGRDVRILVTGADHSDGSTTSVGGASWIFALSDLNRAFLATAMNDAPLTADHGAPLRLLVPGWYGCASIKWVTSIEVVAADAEATPHMLEFAARTHQAPRARLARDFTAAAIEVAAMPVRIEKWLENGRIRYRMIGIIWGGSRRTNALQIRFDARESWAPVDDCPLPHTTDMWSLWTHTWRPQRTGLFQIALRMADPSIPARRLDVYFYTREVRVDEI